VSGVLYVPGAACGATELSPRPAVVSVRSSARRIRCLGRDPAPGACQVGEACCVRRCGPRDLVCCVCTRVFGTNKFRGFGRGRCVFACALRKSHTHTHTHNLRTHHTQVSAVLSFTILYTALLFPFEFVSSLVFIPTHDSARHRRRRRRRRRLLRRASLPPPPSPSPPLPSPSPPTTARATAARATAAVAPHLQGMAAARVAAARAAAMAGPSNNQSAWHCSMPPMQW
jgi:hypothetical protein